MRFWRWYLLAATAIIAAYYTNHGFPLGVWAFVPFLAHWGLQHRAVTSANDWDIDAELEELFRGRR